MEKATIKSIEEILDEIEEAATDLMNQIDDAFDELEGISVADDDDTELESDSEPAESPIIRYAKTEQNQIEE